RITGQLLLESVLLSLIAGAAGLAIAQVGLDLLARAWPANLPSAGSVTGNPLVLGFALSVALATGILAGIVPAVRSSSASLEPMLREGAVQTTISRRRRIVLGVVSAAQLALSLLLLVGAGLLLRSFLQLTDVDPGYRTEGLVAARVRLTPSRYQ